MSGRIRRYGAAVVVGAVLVSCGSPTLVAGDLTLPTTSLTPTTAAATTTTSTLPPPTTSAPTTVPPTTAAPTTPPETLSTPLDPFEVDRPEATFELGTIEIPAIGVNKKLMEGVSLRTLDHGPGHWPGTALPGRLGNVVVAGHRVSHDRPFHDVDKLKSGDEVIMTTAEGRFVYTVTGTQIILPTQIEIIEQRSEHTATLFACHPKGSTKERIVVHLKLAQTAA